MKYNIPKLPLDIEIETKVVLKQTIEANRRLAELKGVVQSMPNASILINTLTLQEAKDSSAIESIITTHDELYKAEIFTQKFVSAGTKEVQTYAEALKCGFEMIVEKHLLTNNAIIKIYRNVKQNTAGFRTTPGTTLKNERTKEVVYEPPQNIDLIQEYMSNLEKFINDNSISDLDPLVKMAIIHHQFESIHPFSDGNGRTGRIINILYLVQQELLDLPVLYLSRYIIINKGKYYQLLQKVRDENQWEEWILFMLKGVEVTAIETIRLVEGIKELMMVFKNKIRENLPKIYSQDLLNNLFRHPYTRIEFLMNELLISKPTAISYLKQLEEKGLVVKYKLGRENFYLNEKLFDLLMNAFHLDIEEQDSIDSDG
ncbi:Fic family protein [Capnocytophaga canis]|uniref:Fic family protein n=1 Tax=Capnocytophaga canis TaxID=1848903 RepID=UPI001BB3C57C|nr:Fic family protein [Capnocytophaga canis]